MSCTLGMDEDGFSNCSTPDVSLTCSESLDVDHLQGPRDISKDERTPMYNSSIDYDCASCHVVFSPLTRSPSPSSLCKAGCDWSDAIPFHQEPPLSNAQEPAVFRSHPREESFVNYKAVSWPLRESPVSPKSPSYPWAMDIYREREVMYLAREGYLELMQPELTPAIREEITAWLFDLAIDLCLSDNTVAVATNLFDRFLSVKTIRISLVKILATTCLLLACKMSDDLRLPLSELVYRADVSLVEMRMMERIVLSKLDWYVNVVTPHEIIIEMTGNMGKSKREAALTEALLLNSLLEYSLVGCRPTVIATACALLGSLLACGVALQTSPHFLPDERIQAAARISGVNARELERCVAILQASMEKTFSQALDAQSPAA